MPKPQVNPTANIKCVWVQNGTDPGCYCLHRPSECRLKFPVDKRPIHKCEVIKKEIIKVSQLTLGTGFRKLLVPSKEKNFYPTIMQKGDYERLQQQATIASIEEQMEAARAAEARVQAATAESEQRKTMLKANLRPQPGAAVVVGSEDLELAGPDQAGHTLDKAEALREEEMEGPRLANQIILASKCHAIRDAQLREKELIKKELAEEERRLDNIMEENRLAAIKRANGEESYCKNLRLTNLAALKKQIQSREMAKIMETERIEEESVRVNQANIAMQLDEAQKLANKHDQQAKLKEILDQCNAEILYYKQLQNEEDRISDQRVQDFLRAKQEREARNKAQQDAIKAAKQKGIAHIANAQKAEQELKEELDRIRNLKIQEDVEREFRRKERDGTIKRNNELAALHEARSQQINDIHRLIAREITKDEQSFNNAARQNEEYMLKEKEIADEHKRVVENHRREIMKQINDKEIFRAEARAASLAQGMALRLEREQGLAREQRVVREKVQQMRAQRVPEVYVKEVEQTLGKHGHWP